MEKDTLRMQFLSGVITESEYKAIINKEIEDAEKASLNESMIGGIVGIGAINQIPSRAKADYETAFEHFLGKKYGLNEEMEVMVDSNMLKSYFNELISLADDMEYTPEMVDELKNLKNTLQGGKISVKNALDLMQQTVDITEDDIDAVEALSQAVDNDDAIIDKAREIYGLDEGKKVKIEEGEQTIRSKSIKDYILSQIKLYPMHSAQLKSFESNIKNNQDLTEEEAKEIIEKFIKITRRTEDVFDAEMKNIKNIDYQTDRDQMAAIQGGYY